MRHTILAFIALAVGGGALIGCGSDSSSGGSVQDYVAQCKRICTKLASCGGELAQGAEICNENCDSIDDNQGSGGSSSAPKCSFSQAKAKADECTKGSCNNLLTCFQELAALCDDGSGGGDGGASGTGGKTSGSGGATGDGGGSGDGGVTGDGGATGDGGTGGTPADGDCSTCAKAETCCKAVIAKYPDAGDPSDCDGLEQACSDSDPENQSLVVNACDSMLTSFASLGGAECK